MTDVPHTLQPKSNAIVEPADQHYDAAVKRRARSYPDWSAAGELVRELPLYLRETGSATPQSVMAALLALAHLGLTTLPRLKHRKMSERIDDLSLEDAKAVLAACERAATGHARRLARAVENNPQLMTLRESLERQRTPAVTARLTGCYHAIPWDVCHDGHLVTREITRAAGIVRWAHAQTAERWGRVQDAVGQCVLFGQGAREIWRHRRPLVVIDRLNAYTVKLVTDAWIYDPQTAVVYTGGELASNPFDPWRMPLVCDSRGWLRALLAIETTPCVIEQRLGGFTVTAACGRVDPNGCRAGDKLPAWMKTLAEIGLVEAYEEDARRKGLPAHRGADAKMWYERFESLLDVTIALENSWKDCRHMSDEGFEAAARVRGNFLRLRHDVTALLERLSQAGEAAHADREAVRLEKRRERRKLAAKGIRRTARTGPAYIEPAADDGEAVNPLCAPSNDTRLSSETPS